ncbi:MAG: hypothetical protein RL088_61 [Verrucomicrobiota bacterium]|jgi:hypothetical protein
MGWCSKWRCRFGKAGAEAGVDDDIRLEGRGRQRRKGEQWENCKFHGFLVFGCRMLDAGLWILGIDVQ